MLAAGKSELHDISVWQGPFGCVTTQQRSRKHRGNVQRERSHGQRKSKRPGFLFYNNPISKKETNPFLQDLR